MWIANVNPNFNTWVDGWLATQVLDLYGITVVRHSISNATVAVNQIRAEIKANNTANGEIDLVWISGVPFVDAKAENLLYGPFATKLPNAVNFDFTSSPIAYDSGHPTAGYEMPFNQAQFVLVYNKIYFPSGPPQSLGDLIDWIVAHPGKFTYPNPYVNPIVGSAFVRHFLYYFPTTDTFADLLGPFNEAAYLKHAPAAFAALRKIAPYLYTKSGSSAPYYPPTEAALDSIYASGGVWMTLAYAPAHAGLLVAQKYFPNRFVIVFQFFRPFLQAFH